MKPRSFVSGTPAIVRDFIGPNKCIPGVFFRKLGPITYSVETSHGQIMKGHINHFTPQKKRQPNDTTPMRFNQIKVHVFSDSSILDHYQYPMMEELLVPQVLPDPKQQIARHNFQWNCHPREHFRHF